MSETKTEKNQYEGAGFTLVYGNNFILGCRLKKNKDDDKTSEVEYMSGKIDVDDNNDPYKTSYSELVEGTGGEFLDNDWMNRIETIYCYQPFTNKWIWNNLLRINDNEFKKLKELDKKLDNWKPGEDNGISFESITGRKTPTSKTIECLCFAPIKDVIEYIDGFKAFHIDGYDNRMKEAKQYGLDDTRLFVCKRISAEKGDESSKIKRRIRGYNVVLFEKNMYELERFVLKKSLTPKEIKKLVGVAKQEGGKFGKSGSDENYIVVDLRSVDKDEIDLPKDVVYSAVESFLDKAPNTGVMFVTVGPTQAKVLCVIPKTRTEITVNDWVKSTNFTTPIDVNDKTFKFQKFNIKTKKKDEISVECTEVFVVQELSAGEFLKFRDGVISDSFKFLNENNLIKDESEEEIYTIDDED